MADRFWTNELVDNLLTFENALWTDDNDGQYSLIFSSHSSAHSTLFNKVFDFETTVTKMPVIVGVEWSQPLSNSGETRGKEYIDGIFQEVFSIAHDYQGIDKLHGVKHPSRIMLNYKESYPVELKSTTVALELLIDRIEKPGQFYNSTKLGNIMMLTNGDYICTLILTYGNFRVKIRLFRREGKRKG